MELWIRSQDGKIISKETELWIRDGVENGRVYKSEEELKKERWEIWGYYHLLGCYESEERALEILDEIQTAITYCSCNLPEEIEEIKKKIKSAIVMNLRTNGMVYKMPEV